MLWHFNNLTGRSPDVFLLRFRGYRLGGQSMFKPDPMSIQARHMTISSSAGALHKYRQMIVDDIAAEIPHQSCDGG
jgi:hypothetical protein